MKINAAVLAALLAVSTEPASPEARARDLIQRALDRQPSGGVAGLLVESHGFADLGLRLQGSRPVSERVDLVERLSIRGDALAFETRTRINPDAEEWLRSVFAPEGTRLLDRVNGRVYADAVEPAQRALLERRVPALLLSEALAADPAPRALPGTPAVWWEPRGGVPLELRFDPATDRLLEVAFSIEMPLRGRVGLRWELLAERDVPGLGPFPSGYRLWLDDQVIREARHTRIEHGAGVGQSLFEDPPDVEPPPPPPPAAVGPQSAPTPRPPMRELAPGVYLAANVRPGFHHLVVDRQDGLLVVDAPTIWWELHTIPPLNWTAPSGVDDPARRLIGMIREALPGREIRHLVLTHFHDDHAGGLGPFLEAGATVLASPTTARALEELGLRVAVDVVEGERLLDDPERPVRILDVGPNPHALGLLVAHLPEQNLVYQSDLFEPLPMTLFPSRERLPAMRFFADWLESQGLEGAAVWAVHGTARVTPEHLAAVR